jgi:hypothetical protein
MAALLLHAIWKIRLQALRPAYCLFRFDRTQIRSHPVKFNKP